ncbi:queuosine precursor transporter [Tomitella biformata]|uniref:queuosine precursor transporter n=1 Tax=Tomitella biformata TaxID=630403 RepID=UPI00056F2E9B|nr:queuosine precursor transporter [Tomitella biformata]
MEPVSGQAPATAGATFASISTAYYPTIVAIFAPLLLISNICATKGVAFGPVVGEWSIITDGGFFLFPLAYVLGDVLSEVYGFKATRRAIYLGFAIASIGALAFWLTMLLPAADFYPNQAAFETVVQAFLQVLLASLAGYLVGQTLNAFVLVRIKAFTKEKHLWARLIGSTVVGEFADTLVFCLIAAGAIGITDTNDLITFVAIGFVYKTAVEILLMPITYRVIAYVKAREPSYQPAGQPG